MTTDDIQLARSSGVVMSGPVFWNELPLTEAQERRRASVARRLNRALADLVALAVDAGCESPSLYYECEGSLSVFDDARGDTGAGSAVDRQNKVALAVSVGMRPRLDCGAW